jgi:hypothetical protein
MPVSVTPAATGADGSAYAARLAGIVQLAMLFVRFDAVLIPPVHVAKEGAASVSIIATAFIISRKAVTRVALRAFVRELLRETSTIEAKIPIIAMTTKSSMRVNPEIRRVTPFVKCLYIPTQYTLQKEIPSAKLGISLKLREGS